MVKKDKFANIKWVKSNAEFTDGRKLVTGFVKGKFTRNEILKELQTLADGINAKGRNAHLGVSVHYANPNDWLPAIYKNVKDKQVLFNPSDSDTTTSFSNIDGLYFYLVELPAGKDLKQKNHTLKKSQKNEHVSMFTKHKK